MNISTETIRRVYDNLEGAYIEVGPGTDVPEMVRIEVPKDHKVSADYFGVFRIELQKEIAFHLANAILKAVEEAK